MKSCCYNTYHREQKQDSNKQVSWRVAIALYIVHPSTKLRQWHHFPEGSGHSSRVSLGTWEPSTRTTQSDGTFPQWQINTNPDTRPWQSMPHQISRATHNHSDLYIRTYYHVCCSFLFSTSTVSTKSTFNINTCQMCK